MGDDGAMPKPDGAPDDDLPPLSRPARAAFALVGLTRLEQFAGRSARELLALHGVGPKAIRELRESLAAAGLPPLT
jgi:hypothetical protein